MKFSKKVDLNQLKSQVYNHYQVKNSKQLKKVSTLAIKLDLRSQKSWQILAKENSFSKNNLIFLASRLVEKRKALNVINTELKSLSEDLATLEKQLRSLL